MSAIESYHAALREIGCVACLIQFGRPRMQGAIHHLFDAHERDDRLVVFLCEPGHHQFGFTGKDESGKPIVIVPFHPGGERKFRNTYGFGEKEMLARSIIEYVKKVGA